jgi:hypothetical protein
MGVKAILKRIIWLAAQVPVLLPTVIALYEFKPDERGWRRKHPYDRALASAPVARCLAS